MEVTVTKDDRRARARRPGSLSGTSEAMEILNVPRSTLSRWLEKGEMPKPEDVPNCGPIWRTADLERFRGKRAAEADDE